MLKILEIAKKVAVALGKGTLKVISPSAQIQAVGGRRVWVSILLTLLSMAFVLVSASMGIPASVMLATLGIAGATGGSFVVGESIRDVADTKKQ